MPWRRDGTVVVLGTCCFRPPSPLSSPVRETCAAWDIEWGSLVPTHHSYGHCCESKIISVDPSGLWIDRVCDRVIIACRIVSLFFFFFLPFSFSSRFFPLFPPFLP